MPQAEIDGLSINYDVQGEGEPLVLIPYLAADHACYAFQLPAYTEHFNCISVGLPGSGESDRPERPYSTETYADQVAGFMAAIGVESAQVAGVSLGAGVAMHLAARYPRARAFAVAPQRMGSHRRIPAGDLAAMAFARGPGSRRSPTS
jgi:pimeloyl-ACP methyl ester carboxylesterase